MNVAFRTGGSGRRMSIGPEFAACGNRHSTDQPRWRFSLLARAMPVATNPPHMRGT